MTCTVNTENAPVRTMWCGATQGPLEGKENAHRAAGNLLISANYFGGLERFCVSASEIKDGGGYVFLPLLLLLSQKLIGTVIIGPLGLSSQVALSLIPTLASNSQMVSF